MTRQVPHVRLGELLRHVHDAVEVRADQQYPNVGIYSFGRGVFAKPPISGSTTSARELYRARAGQFVYSRLFAFEGAYGLIPDELDGAFVSNEFPLLEPVSTRLRVGYLAWYFRLTRTWTDIATQATGMGSRRQRIHPEMIFAHAIPLPLPDEQDRIVATLDAAAARVAEAQRLCQEVDHEADALCRSILSDPRHPTTPTPMRELVTLRPPDVDVKAPESYHFAGIYCFGKGMFRGQTRLGAEFSYDTLSRLRAGDFTYPKLMAWEGALCVVPPECDGLYVSTEYPVFEIDTDRVLPDVLDVYFRSPEVWPKLSGTSKGTNVRRRRLNPKQFLDYSMPLPPRHVQERVVEVRARMAGVKSNLAVMVTELEALMPSILDRAFKGELSGVAAGPLSTVSVAAAAPVWRIADFAAVQSEIVRREKDNPTLGRKKLYKSGYLAAALVGARLDPSPKQMAAGPFNAEAQDAVEQHAKQSGWFTYTGRSNGDDPAGHYKPRSSATAASSRARTLLGDRWAAFNTMMSAVAGWDSDKAELIATTHAAWNDLVAAGETITEAAVIKRFYDWSREKTKFTEAAIRGAMGTLRSLGLEPTGGGPLFVGAGDARLF